MKSVFKSATLCLAFFIITPVHARDIILIENLASHSEGQMLLKIIQDKFKIPRKLITYRNITGNCVRESEAIMQLCLKNDGEMEVVKVNKVAVDNSLRAFLETEE
jgi:hypothetical protein